MKNTHSFFSWQGNNLSWNPYIKWIVFAIIAVITILIFLFRKKIQAKKDRKPRFFSSNEKSLQIIGIAGLLYMAFKMILYIVYEYPLKWELLNLHICRIHFIVMMVFLIIKKPKMIMYTTYISTMGAIFAIYYGNQSMSEIPQNTTKFEILSKSVSFYDVGPDNFFYWDFFVFHILITIIPIYLWTAYKWKMTAVNMYRMIIVYTIGIIIIWSFDAISQFFPIEWQSNNWYIGPAAVNDYYDVIGWMSGWPQNLFSYLLFGYAVVFSLNAVYLAIRQKERKSSFKEWASEHKGIIKRIIDTKDRGY